MLKNIIVKNQNLAQYDANGATVHWMTLFLRITLAIVFFPHGAQMMLGWFGGGGFTATMSFMTTDIGLPWLIGFLVVQIQFLGSICLAIGLFTRLQAFAFLIILAGMVVTSHLDHGFFMNWFGNQTGEGYEFHLLAMGMCLALLFGGGGKYALSRKTIFS